MKAFRIVTKENVYLLFALSKEQAKVWFNSFNTIGNQDIVFIDEVDYTHCYILQ